MVRTLAAVTVQYKSQEYGADLKKCRLTTRTELYFADGARLFIEAAPAILRVVLSLIIVVKVCYIVGFDTSWSQLLSKICRSKIFYYYFVAPLMALIKSSFIRHYVKVMYIFSNASVDLLSLSKPPQGVVSTTQYAWP